MIQPNSDLPKKKGGWGGGGKTGEECGGTVNN